MATKSSTTKKTSDTVKSPSTATLKLIGDAESAWKVRQEGDDTFVVAAAKATYAAHVDGIIGKGQRYENSTAYGLLFKDRDGKGASKSSVTRFRRLGAYLHLGGEAGSVTWHRLVSKANDPRIGQVLDSEKATLAKVETAVKKCFPRGKFTPAAKPSDTAPGESNGNKSPASEREESVPNGVPGMLTMLEKIAARMEGKPVTPAESERLAAILARFETVTVESADMVESKRSA